MMMTSLESWRLVRQAARGHQPMRRHVVPLALVTIRDGIQLTQLWKSEHAAVHSESGTNFYRAYEIHIVDDVQEQFGALLIATASLVKAIVRETRYRSGKIDLRVKSDAQAAQLQQVKWESCRLSIFQACAMIAPVK